MKKSLIALAALASIGTAFAQSSVTLSGKFGSAYGKSVGGDSGLSVTDGDVRFTAVEDLGGGLKATASMELRVRGRGNRDSGPGAITAGEDHIHNIPATNSGVGGRNATVNLTGGFGSVTLGAVEAGNGIIGRGWGGAIITQATGFDGNLLDGVSNVDWAMYETPALVPGLKLNFQRVDSITNPGAGKGALSGNVFGANYEGGALSIGFDYTSFSNTVKRTRASASYDLGFMKVGAGYSDKSNNNGQFTAGVSAPFGPLTLGAIYAVNDEVDSATQDAVQAKGWAASANYALSKRTAVNLTLSNTTRHDSANLVGNQYRFRVMHSF